MKLKYSWLLPAAALFLAGCGKTQPAQTQISCAATIFPVYTIVRAIGGDKVAAQLLVPPGAEAHSFEPRPQDAAQAASAKVFVHAGAEMEPWAGNFARAIGAPGMEIADLSVGVKLLNSGDVKDPHYWLDIGNAAVMARNTAAALSNAAPQNSEYYSANLAQFEKRLSELDLKYKTALSSCQGEPVIYAGHFSFGYVAARYGLKFMALGDVSPEAEPPAERMAALAHAAKAAHVKTIFYEEMSSSKFAKAIAQEAGADVLPLNPMHEITREQYDRGADYFSIMESNLKNLSSGLRCVK